jgi:hypothetical protein
MTSDSSPSQSSTALPASHCLIHGAFSGLVCPGCSTAVPFQPTSTEVFTSPPVAQTPPRRLMICERCWTVIAIDGENNERREPQMCSHLGPFVQAVTT